MKNKRIAIVTPSCPPFSFGGISSAHFNLAEMLLSEGYEVCLFTYDDTQRRLEDPSYIKRHGVPKGILKIIRLVCTLFFRVVDRGMFAYQLCDIIQTQCGAWLLRREIKKFSPDIIIFPDHGCPAFAIGSIVGSKSIVISHHNPARFSSSLIYGKPVSNKDIQWAIFVENRALCNIDVMICPTRYMQKQAEITYKFTGAIRIAPNVISENMMKSIRPCSVRTELCCTSSGPVIYIPDAGSPIKGERYVFEIVRRIGYMYPNAIFLLTGNIGQVLKEEITSLSMVKNRVFMPGYLPYKKNLSYISSCTLCVSPTMAENFGMAILEASYFGIPTVTFDTGGNAEVIENDISGIVVPYLDIESLIESVAKILQPEYEQKRIALGCAAKDRAHFLIESGRKEYVSIFTELLDESEKCQLR